MSEKPSNSKNNGDQNPVSEPDEWNEPDGSFDVPNPVERSAMKVIAASGRLIAPAQS
jgi:hypothetical protein